MKLNLPRELRAALYIILMVGSPLVAYGQARFPDIVGQHEITLWLALSAVIALIAGLNLTPTPAKPVED